ncbi:MAG TPA: chloride channel protein [Candidatus Baltobacteraceae bacterium]|nr:chloride channel protein [Candidatus Baltobacteraceae bacterium]
MITWRPKLPKIEYVLRDGRYALRLGRFYISQSTFLVVTAVLVGIGGGFGAVLFRALIYGETQLAFNVIGTRLGAILGPVGVVVQLALGGAIAAWIASTFAPEARGHGVPEVMEAVALRGGRMRPRVIGIKALASASSIGFGGSCGREGPIVQIGSAIGSVIGRITQAPAPIVRTLVACGAAAGISATFNAPIGGVFFAAEVILGEFAPRSFAAIVVASVVSAVVGRAFLGNHPSFNASAFNLVSPAELTLYAILGIIAAVWAAGFVRMLYGFEDAFDKIRLQAWIKGAIGFALVGVIGIWFPQIFGVGYGPMQQVLDEHVAARHALVLAALKPLATSLTLGAGGSGGVFAPSLFTGAFLGDWFGRIVHDLFPAWTAAPAAYGLVGMAAVFAAAAEAPITAIMIVFEMSNDYTIVLPLMVCVVISTLLGRRLIGGTVYELKLLRRGIDWQRVRRPRFLSRVNVSSIERTPPVVADPDETIASLATRVASSDELMIPVCNQGQFFGVVSSADLAHAVSGGKANNSVRTIANASPERLARDDTVERAATLMADPAIALLPVVEPSTERLLGIVTRRDVLQIYRSLTDV